MRTVTTMKVLIAAAVVAVLSAGLSVAAIPSDGEIAFKVLRKDADIGSHRLSFRREGDDLHVEIAIDLEVGIGPITLYEYTHRNREVWRDGRLLRLDSRTNDDGKEHEVTVRRVADGLRVEASGLEPYVAPADTIPTSYWHPETITRSRLLNTQNGEMEQVSIEAAGDEWIEVKEKRLEARKYEVSGDLKLRLWYDRTDEGVGQLLKLAFSARGAEVRYQRLQPAGETETVQAFRKAQ